jgi:hypothetical protein
VGSYGRGDCNPGMVLFEKIAQRKLNEKAMAARALKKKEQRRTRYIAALFTSSHLARVIAQ